MEHKDDNYFEGSINFWPSFADISMMTIMIFIILFFAQFMMFNLEAFQLTQIGKKQKEIECRIKRSIEDTMGPEMLNELMFTQTFREQRISFSTGILFESGRATLQPNGIAILGIVGKVLVEASRDTIFESIQVEGHTDDVPVKPGSEISDNWELASLRATQVVRFFDQNVGLNPVMIPMSAVGFSQYKPTVTYEEFLDKGNAAHAEALNDHNVKVEQWRDHNRRVELKIYYNGNRWIGDNPDFVPCNNRQTE